MPLGILLNQPAAPYVSDGDNCVKLRSEQAEYTAQVGMKEINTFLFTPAYTVTAGYAYQIRISYKAGLNLCSYIPGYTSEGVTYPPNYSYATGVVRAYVFFLDASDAAVATLPLISIDFPDTTESSPNLSNVDDNPWATYSTSAIAPPTATKAYVYFQVGTRLRTTLDDVDFPDLTTSGVYIDLYGMYDAVVLLESDSAIMYRKIYFDPNFTVVGGPMQLETQTTPADDPDPGKWYLYPKSDGMYIKSDAGVEYKLAVVP